jgi:hypothetical protein
VFRDSAGRYSDSLPAGRPGVGIPVGAKFSGAVQTGGVANPAFYAKGIRSFPGVKRLGRGVDHPPSSSAEFKESVYYFPSGTSWPILG